MERLPKTSVLVVWHLARRHSGIYYSEQIAHPIGAFGLARLLHCWHLHAGIFDREPPFVVFQMPQMRQAVFYHLESRQSAGAEMPSLQATEVEWERIR